jgi:hypothetical protein
MRVKRFDKTFLDWYSVSMIFLPVTRQRYADDVIDALDKSDCPKRVILYLDNWGCENWIYAFLVRGWSVTTYSSYNNEPPVDRVARRERHRAMRKRSQELTRDCGRVLYLEDDTIVPPDVWSRLNAVIDSGYTAASGVQRDRHGSGWLGLWHYDTDSQCYDPVDIARDSGVYSIDAVGHYCLLVDGRIYAQAQITEYDTSIDRTHTAQFGPIGVDSSVWCGHLTDNGVIE